MDGTRRGVGRTLSEPMVADVRAARDRGGLMRGATRGRESNPARARGRSALLVRLRASAETSRSARTGATRAIAKGGGERARLVSVETDAGVGGGGDVSVGVNASLLCRPRFEAARRTKASFKLGACARLDECALNGSRLPHQQLQPM
jgi:hypothetical protein